MAVQPNEIMALMIALRGISDALRVLPHDSVWWPCFAEFRTGLSAQTDPQLALGRHETSRPGAPES